MLFFATILLGSIVIPFGEITNPSSVPSSMEQILQSVFGSSLLSLFDGFSIYNQVLVAKEDHLKTTFRTKWGTYAYNKMPFGLINVGEAFLRAMDIAFKGLINRSMVGYLDDITVYSKN